MRRHCTSEFGSQSGSAPPVVPFLEMEVPAATELALNSTKVRDDLAVVGLGECRLAVQVKISHLFLLGSTAAVPAGYDVTYLGGSCAVTITSHLKCVLAQTPKTVVGSIARGSWSGSSITKTVPEVGAASRGSHRRPGVR